MRLVVSRMEEVEIIEKDPDQWRCTTSSSCKRSCLVFFITFQFAIICMLGITLRTFQNDKAPKMLPNQSSSAKSDGYYWQTLPDKMEKLNENSVYAKFNITRQNIRPKVNLLIIVSSAPLRVDRRMAIRETWWNQSTSNEKISVKRVFFTDFPDNSTETGQGILEEQRRYNDMGFQDLKGGIEFGRRFIYHLLWAMQNFDFDYFMRMDDDYFFCLERFLHELPMPMRKMYHWGYVHCKEGIVRPEESVIMLSRDLVETFLSQNPAEIKCHPWADQMIATWVQELKLDKLYNHDTRLHHHPPLKDIKIIEEKFNLVCRKFIGVHGSYPEHMRKLWKLRAGREYVGVQLDEYTVQCNLPQVFTWDHFTDNWRYKPKRLIENPMWDTFKQDHDAHLYVGRQQGQG